MKLHYIYYAIQKNGKPKYGATTDPTARATSGRYKSIKVLEEYKCPMKCGDREIELQIKYLGKRDTSMHYANMLLMQAKSQTPEVWKKISVNTRKAVSNSEIKKKQSDNAIKMWKNPKHIEFMKRGVSLPFAKLTDELVRQIRKEYIPRKVSSRMLGKKYNVNQKSILNIVNGVTWKHVI